jgi:hypothetical protein
VLNTLWWVTLAAALVAVLGVYLSWTAGRIDRLHARVDAARAALDAQLVRRSSVALELAVSGLLDPAASVLLAGAAHEARESDEDGRELAESDLSRALRAALDHEGQAEALRSQSDGALLVEELETAARRVVMARRFHNDVVRATQAVRRKRVARYLRLAGRAEMPRSFEMDDGAPRWLEREL